LLNESEFEPRITQNVFTPRFKLPRTKFNSTASLYIDTANIIIDPDLEKTLRCKSIALHWMMKDHATKKPVLSDLYSEDYYKKKQEAKLLNNNNSNKSSFQYLKTDSIPDIEDILKFLKNIYYNAQIPAEVGIMALAYIERFLTLTDITFHISNWRLICLGAIMVARKVWIDKSRISNLIFIKLCPFMTIDDLATLEREYLHALQFIVAIKASIYAKYYFALSSIAEKNETNFPLKPLSRDDEQRLERLSHPNAHRRLPRPRRRSISVHDGPSPKEQAVGGA